MLNELHGKPLNRTPDISGELQGRLTFPHVCIGSPFAFQQHGESGRYVSELFPHLAGHVDDLAFIHGVKTDNQNHGPSTLHVTTGSQFPGHPSVGSVVSQQLGPRDEGVPPYVVMGYPNSLRGPGFLGSKYTYIYLTDTESGPNGLRRPPNVDDARWRRRVQLLDTLRQGYLARNHGDHRVENYNATITEGFGMTDGDFMQAFTLDHEPDDVRERYGDEFGQRCLLARRLVASGVRFVEVAFNLNFVNGTGWDTHRHGQKDQYKLIQSLDQSVSALIEDLERNNLLETTLVVLATEFGRPAKFDGEGGRGHQSSAFTNVLFGGGLKTGQVVGVTDELSEKPVEDPVSVPDWLATIYSTLGINPAHELFAGQRPVPITDHGKPIAKLFS